MSPEKARRNLREFLCQFPEVRQRIFHDILDKKIANLLRLTGKHSFSEKDRKEFYISHANEIMKETELVLDDFCKHAIPASQSWYILKGTGTLLTLILPGLYCIARYALLLVSQSEIQIGEISACIISGLLLFALLVTSLVQQRKDD